MKKYYLHKLICSLLLVLVFVTVCNGQNEYFFHCGLKDKAGNLWFGTVGAGVYRYDAASGAFTNFMRQDGLSDNNVSSIHEDKAGNLWFSTEHGVCRYNGKSFTDISIAGCNNAVNCILEDRNGNFWFGTNGWGVCRYNPASGASANFTKEQGLGSNAVQCMLQDKAGTLWVGERAGGVCRYDSASGRFTKINGEGCLSSQIMGMVEDKTGNIWFANLYEGVCRYDPASGGFAHFTEANGLCNDTITCIFKDKAGNLWFGSDFGKVTGRGGVCRYDPSAALRTGSNSFTSFTTKDGLANVDVWTIVEDNDGNIWVGTRNGLFRYHSPSGRFIDYTHKVNIR